MPARFLEELRRRDRVLFAAGAVSFGLAAAFLIASSVDPRTVLGIDPWVKPFKFAASIGIYLWTLGWLMAPLRARRPNAVRVIGWGSVAAMAGEIVLIAAQSMRGVPSHFGRATPLDAAIFAIMGLLILGNTVLAAWLLLLFFREDTGWEPAYLWGVRLGLALLVIGSFEGALMIGNGRHSVGGPDGGPGLPLVNFSTTHGDLRPAHALGLHGLQVIPLFAFLLSRSGAGEGRSRTSAVIAFAGVYLGAFLAALGWALAGRPFLPLPAP